MIPLPDFVDANWLARRVQASPRSLRLIDEAADEIMAESGLAGWPADLKTERDFAELFLRGFAQDPDFSRYCARAAGSQYDNRNKQSPTFFRRAALDAKIRGAKLLGGDSGKLDFFATLEELAERHHGDIAAELAFLMLAEGGFSSRAARIIEVGGDAFGTLSETVKAMKRADLLRGLREKGVSGEQSEAFLNYCEARETLATAAAAAGEPSRESLTAAARALAGAADALAQWECASYTPRAPQAEVGALRAALETMAPILNAQGAQALHERGGKSERALAASAARVLPRMFYAPLGRAVAEAEETAKRAVAKLDRARAMMKSGDLSKMEEIKTANEESAAFTAQALDQIDAIAERIQTEESVPAGKSPEDLIAEITAEINAAFSGGNPPPPKPSGGKPRRARKKDDAPPSPESSEAPPPSSESPEASAQWAAESAGKEILGLMATGDYAHAKVAGRAAVEAFGEDGAPFAEAELEFAAAARDPDPARADDLELAAIAASEAIAKNGAGDDGEIARRLSLFSAALAAWPITGGESAAGQILHDLSIDKEFNQAAWPLKEALGAAVRGGLFLAPAAAEQDEKDESEPAESAAEIEKRIRDEIEHLGAKRLNFTLGQQVQRELLSGDGEIGALVKELDGGGEGAAAAARKFAHDYGTHAAANRLVEHAVERTPGSHNVEGRARVWFVESIEKIAADCAAFAAAAAAGEGGADWFSQMRRNLAAAAQTADAALLALAERHPPAAPFAEQCRADLARFSRQ